MKNKNNNIDLPSTKKKTSFYFTVAKAEKMQLRQEKKVANIWLFLQGKWCVFLVVVKGIDNQIDNWFFTPSKGPHSSAPAPCLFNADDEAKGSYIANKVSC